MPRTGLLRFHRETHSNQVHTEQTREFRSVQRKKGNGASLRSRRKWGRRPERFADELTGDDAAGRAVVRTKALGLGH